MPKCDEAPALREERLRMEAGSVARHNSQATEQRAVKDRNSPKQATHFQVVKTRPLVFLVSSFDLFPPRKVHLRSVRICRPSVSDAGSRSGRPVGEDAVRPPRP